MSESVQKPEEIPGTMLIDYAELDDLDFDKLRPILIGILQNISILNIIMARLADAAGLVPGEEAGDPGYPGTGQYL